MKVRHAELFFPPPWETPRNTAVLVTAAMTFAFARPAAGLALGSMATVLSVLATIFMVNDVLRHRALRAVLVAFPLFGLAFFIIELPLYCGDWRQKLAGSALGWGAVRVAGAKYFSLGFLDASPWDGVLAVPFEMGAILIVGLFLLGYTLRKPHHGDLDVTLLAGGVFLCAASFLTYIYFIPALSGYNVKTSIHLAAAEWSKSVVLLLLPLGGALAALGILRCIKRHIFAWAVVHRRAQGYQLVPAFHFSVAPPVTSFYRGGAQFAHSPGTMVLVRQPTALECGYRDAPPLPVPIAIMWVPAKNR